ncbi:DUF6911 family protein [Massilia antarctica]|uniref:DUF6911 family protein n=1 Tax=Massilia antarctica TaxID=2765360 RepID=UPI001E606B75|nr:hypothetical protein [Massilia antarctica]
MNILDLSWSRSSVPHRRGGRIDKPCWEEIADQLRMCFRDSGTVGLEAESDAGESRTLQVRSERGRHLITMGLEIHGEWVVREYNNPVIKMSDSRVDILGDMWSEKIICYDWDVVLDIFKDFFEFGEIGNVNFG